jgi:hypothetical protein
MALVAHTLRLERREMDRPTLLTVAGARGFSSCYSTSLYRVCERNPLLRLGVPKVVIMVVAARRIRQAAPSGEFIAADYPARDELQILPKVRLLNLTKFWLV